MHISRFHGHFLGLIGACLVLAGAMNAFGLLQIGGKLAWASFAVGSGTILAGIAVIHMCTRFALGILALFLGGTGKLWLTQPEFFMGVSSKIGQLGNAIALAGVVIQAAIVLALAWQIRRRLISVIVAMGIGRIFLFLLCGAVIGVSIMGYLPIGQYKSYVMQLFASAAFVGLATLNLFVLALAPAPDVFKRTPPVTVLIPLAAITAYLLATLAIERIPHLEDEVAYLFQARTFLMGRLWVEPPPVDLQPWLAYYLMVVDGERWYSATMPGWSLVLTIGELIGDPWLLNPVLAAICVALVYRVTRQLSDARHASLAALLAAISPWFVMASSTLMPHIAAILATLLAWTLLLGIADRPRPGIAFLAGLALGYLFLNRQLEGVIVGVFTGLIVLGWLRREKGIATVLAYAAGCIALGIWFFIYNGEMTGDPLSPPLANYLNEFWHEGANSFGFGPEKGAADDWGQLDYAPGHSLSEGLVGLAQNLFALQVDLFGWVAGSLALILVHLLWGTWTRWDKLALTLCVVIALIHTGYWFTGSFFIGPRYWFGMFAPLIYLSARGVITIEERSGTTIIPVLLVSCLFALLVHLPWRGSEKLKGYGGYRAEVAQAARDGIYGTDLVLFTGPRNPGPVLFMNHPSLPDDKPLFLNATRRNPADAPAVPGRGVRIVGHNNPR